MIINAQKSSYERIGNFQLGVPREKLLELSFDEKLKYLDSLRINYPKMHSILEKIEECQNSILTSKRPTCMCITGPSGSGKTTITEIHKNKYPDIETSEGINKTVLYSRIPCPARIGSLPVKMLYDIGDPFYSKRLNIALQTQRLYDILKSCNVRLIVLDEVQHLVDRNSEKLIRDSSDWFKELIDSTNIPIVFLGIPDTKKIFIENKQLANRVRLYEELKPFVYDDLFRKVLHLFDMSLPLEEPSLLAEADISMRIYFATNGLMKNIRDLIVESGIIALRYNKRKITMPILATAFEKILFFNREENPFLPGFEVN